MMDEEGLVFSGPMTQPKAELWIKKHGGSLRGKMISRKYEVQDAIQYFTESAATWWKMHQAIQGCNGVKTSGGIQEDFIEIPSYSEVTIDVLFSLQNQWNYPN